MDPQERMRNRAKREPKNERRSQPHAREIVLVTDGVCIKSLTFLGKPRAIRGPPTSHHPTSMRDQMA
jgi:hypothetical protein